MSLWWMSLCWMSYAECHYTECHYAECHCAECHYGSQLIFLEILTKFWEKNFQKKTSRTDQRDVVPGNTKGGSITVPLTSCLTGFESAVWQLTILVFICKTDYSKPVIQEVNGTEILPPLVFPGSTHTTGWGKIPVWIYCIMAFLAIGNQLMLNPRQKILYMQCPSSACMLCLCVYFDLYGIYHFECSCLGFEWFMA